MIDLVSLTVEAGDGGDGRVSFRREKYVPKGGPDGGYGGDGGSVKLIGNRHFNTLKHYAGKKEIKAEPGGFGGRKKKTGKKGKSVEIEVPVGTIVWLEAENEASARRRERYGIEHTLARREVAFKKYSVQKETEPIPYNEPDELEPLPERIKLFEVTKENQEIVLCQGGFGGRGSVAFKSSTNITPLEAEHGTFGEQRRITLELKLLADIGLVGYPNAGKSTLLSKVTRANPKTADYPFTTIEPNLGVLSLPEGRDLMMADIPGLIEGASEGKGLGYDFLRHIENSQALVFVLFLEERVVSDESLSNEDKAEEVWRQYLHLTEELEDYQAEMLDKPYLIALNKIDIYSEKLVAAIKDRFDQKGQEIHPFSAVTGLGLDELTNEVQRLVGS
jgi:GTP-binding protein